MPKMSFNILKTERKCIMGLRIVQNRMKKQRFIYTGQLKKW